jgi:hypothetical protein
MEKMVLPIGMQIEMQKKPSVETQKKTLVEIPEKNFTI